MVILRRDFLFFKEFLRVIQTMCGENDVAYPFGTDGGRMEETRGALLVGPWVDVKRGEDPSLETNKGGLTTWRAKERPHS